MTRSFSLDGRRAAGRRLMGTVVYLSDPRTGEEVAPPLGHEARVTFAQFSPDGSRLLTASQDGAVRMWDAGTGRPLTPPLRHGRAVSGAAVSPDGSRVITASDDGTVRVWDGVTGQPLLPAFQHAGAVFPEGFSPGGDRVVTAGADNTARVWNVGTGQPLTPPLQHNGTVHSACFSPDGCLVLTTADKVVRTWDAATGEPVTPPWGHDGVALSARFAPDGVRVMTAAGEQLAIWDLVPEERPLDDLLRLSEVLSGLRIDETGGLVPVEAERFERAWQALQARDSQEGPAGREEMLAWHGVEAQAAQALGLRWAALAHLDRLIALEPENWMVHGWRATVCAELGRRDEAVAAFQEAIRLKPDLALLHYNLGIVLGDGGRLEEALAAYRRGIRLKQKVSSPCGLALTLLDKGRTEEALAVFHEILRHQPDDARGLHLLAEEFLSRRRLDEAIVAFREAFRIKKVFLGAGAGHNDLGRALAAKGRLDEAIAEYREAIRLRKEYGPDGGKEFPAAHINIGRALMAKGQTDEAITEYQEAIRSWKDDPEAHVCLGNTLRDQGRPEEAIGEYREASRAKKAYALPHCNAGLVLLAQGRFREAVEELRLGHELGQHYVYWPHPSAQWLRDAKCLADLGPRLPALLMEQEQPRDAGECLALAQHCRQRKQFSDAVHWYGEAFAAQPALADDPSTGDRYNAACAAALSGCGQGQDAGRLSDKERAGLRKQARDWLRADLEAWRRLLEKGAEKNRWGIAHQLQYWLEDNDFAGERGEQAPAEGSPAERAAWQKLWQEVEALWQRAAGPTGKMAPTGP
jgi:tetratricopeptide (TPR) repeat protein